MKSKNQWAGWTEKKVRELKAKGRIRSYRVLAPRSSPKLEQAIQEAKSAAPPAAGTGKDPRTNSPLGNVTVWYEGIRFPSIRQRERYKVLKMLEKAGQIRALRLEVPFELNEGGTHSIKYFADFVYEEAPKWIEVVEDSKGHLTRMYKSKRRLMLKIYGIEIRET